MHTCAPPKAALTEWLDDNPTFKPIGHLLLEQLDSCKLDLVKEMRPYFESAHLDAREHFHKQLGIDLHPDVASGTTHATYPNCLDATTVRGLFGEVMAGLMTESYPYIGGHSWSVPVFLFRYHADVEAYLFDLVREPKKQRQTWGRFGTDFLGLSLWRATHPAARPRFCAFSLFKSLIISRADAATNHWGGHISYFVR